MATGKKITWVDDNQYISGTATGITIESDDTLQMLADTKLDIDAPDIEIETQATTLSIKDDEASSFVIQEDSNAYMTFTTTTGSGNQKITASKNLDATAGLDVSGGALTINNQAITQSTGGQVTFAGNVDANAGLDVTGATTLSSTLSCGAITSSGNFAFGNGADRSIAVDTTAAGTSGKALTISAGSVTTGSGTADRTGGNLTLSAGSGTGSGTSAMIFKTAVAGSSGTGVSAANERMRIHTNGNVAIGTVNPETKLHLKTSNVSDTALTIQSNNYASSNATILFKTDKSVSAGTFTTAQLQAGFTGTTYSTAYLGFYSHHGSGDSSGGTLSRSMTLINGNVGIGVTSPIDKLNIGGDIRLGDVSNGAGNIFFGTPTSWTARIQHDATGQLKINNASATTAIFDNSNNTTLNGTLTVAGNVDANAGLDVTGANLTIASNIAFGNGANRTISVDATAHDTAGKVLTISSGSTTAGTTNDKAGGNLIIEGGQGKGTGAGGDIVFKTASAAGSSASTLNALSEKLKIESTGRITVPRASNEDKSIGTNNLYLRENNDNSFLSFHDNDYLVWNKSSNYLGLYIGGSEKMRVDSAGNVGIGETSPSYKLTVNGDIGFKYGSAQTQFLRPYSSGSLWYIDTNAATSTTISTRLLLAESHDWNKQVEIGYNANGATINSGIMHIGQKEYNTYATHGTTQLYVNGAKKITLNKNGFGINTNDPYKLLDVDDNLIVQEIEYTGGTNALDMYWYDTANSGDNASYWNGTDSFWDGKNPTSFSGNALSGESYTNQNTTDSDSQNLYRGYSTSIDISTVGGYDYFSTRWEGWLYPPMTCLLYTSPSPRDQRGSRMPSSA